MLQSIPTPTSSTASTTCCTVSCLWMASPLSHSLTLALQPSIVSLRLLTFTQISLFSSTAWRSRPQPVLHLPEWLRWQQVPWRPMEAWAYRGPTLTHALVAIHRRRTLLERRRLVLSLMPRMTHGRLQSGKLRRWRYQGIKDRHTRELSANDVHVYRCIFCSLLVWLFYI